MLFRSFFSSGAVGSSSVRTVFILVEPFVCWCLGSKVRVERVAMVSRVSVSVKKNRRECERVINRVLGSGLSIASDFEEL